VLQPGVNCWRVERATRAAVIVDADEYFRLARAAMLQAQKRVMLIGWDFDARIDLDRRSPSGDSPTSVGKFIYWLAEHKPQLEIYVLRWDVGALKTLLHGSTLLTVFKWMRHARIHVRLDSSHPATASHHQKIVVLDDRFAFCGGIDMTADRWDTREHRDADPQRRRPNGEPHGPWHDATTAVEGPVAEALGELARERWTRAGGDALTPVTSGADCWPKELRAQFTDVQVAIARSAPEYDDRPAVLEIERLYLDLVARAKRFIYIENQYFASRRIALAVAARLDEVDGPEVVVINPFSAKGWLEPLVMDTARARLFQALHRRDRDRRFRIYHPYTAEGTPIYVHAKIMIVDDEALRIGSSNLNSRSMRLDTECDVLVSTTSPPNASLGPAIRSQRDELLAEHLGVDAATVSAKIEECDSLIQAIEALRGDTHRLRPYTTPDLSEVEKWLATNNPLEPDETDEPFEPLSRPRSLLRLSKRT
jgi:phosphatidylserine/phosphatidylglycerophosphate/cardiolipin synthase-like enzyme